MYNECRHIMPSGKKCHSPALRDKSYCYYHTRLHRLGDSYRRVPKELALPSIEDATGIQIALTRILGALNSLDMDTRRAGVLLYGLQIAAQVTSRASLPSPAESVRNTICEDNGDVLAPVITICEPEEHCIECSEYEKCDKMKRVDKDECA